MLYRGNGDFFSAADVDLLHAVRRYATAVHSRPWSVEEIARMRGIDIDRLDDLPTTTLGTLGASRKGIMWGIVLNDKLGPRASRTVTAHELGHSWQTIKSGKAFCSLKRGRDPHEEAANAHGALMAVPLSAIAGSDLYCYEAPTIAKALGVSAPYVHLRNGLAVLLGEKRGDDGTARAVVNLALLAHEGWMSRTADRMATPAA